MASLTVIPDPVSIVYVSQFGSTANPFHTGTVVTASPAPTWDTDLGSYSYTASSVPGVSQGYSEGAYATYAFGAIPSSAFDVVGAETLATMSVTFTARYDDDQGGSGAAGVDPALGIQMGDGIHSITLVPEGADEFHRDAFRVGNTATNTFTSAFWCKTNSNVPATADDITAAFNFGSISVTTPLVSSFASSEPGVEFSTYAFVYALALTVDYGGSSAVVTSAPIATPQPLRIHPRDDGLGTSPAARIWPPPTSRQFSNRPIGYL